ncbi:hypothetical protein CC80DRAFT_408587 [Byssothecium circinans]|uniref:Uncharacterized protein n=1 Tax=Byssothecium circinans TaxID=147558 RepID=A0A6A5U0F3_9PLEO|nr:hypothetical protein CC80DRAFT_408587 [Byssothecium circinans]
MFSEQDLRNMFEQLPPQTPEKVEVPQILPPLILSSRGEGFVTGQSVSRSFENLVQNEPERLPLSAVSNRLDIDQDTSLQLLRASPHLALLSENENTVITTSERNAIAEKFRESLKSRVVSKASFSNETNVSRASIDALAHSKDDSAGIGEQVRELDDHLFTASYEQEVTEKLKEKLNLALQEAEPLEITSSLVTGEAPLWFIQRATENIIRTQDMSSHFHVDEDANATRYVPRESIIRRRDDVISRLESGELTHIDIRTFAEDFKEILPSFAEANEYLAELDSFFHLGPFAISRSWIAWLVNQYIEVLDDQDYVDCAKDLPSDLPRAIYDSVLELVVHRVISWDSSASEDFCQSGTFVLTNIHHDRERTILFEHAKAQATVQWQAYKATPSKDLKFRIANILAKVPPDRHVLRAVAEEPEVESAIAEHFWVAISNLESQNEADFATSWTKRVSSRQSNYCEALKAIKDVKLHDQLAELLAHYLQKDLIPDTIVKAKLQGLVCSRKTQKNVQKIETALTASKKDLAGLLLLIEKFGKKQDIPDLEGATLEESKGVMVADMIRRMQKPKTDGPLLFLTLVVVLFAKHYPGVVYATGKFAPKLLKILKAKVSVEDYEQLEAWKELAKTGALGAEEQKAMREMAEEG